MKTTTLTHEQILFMEEYAVKRWIKDEVFGFVINDKVFIETKQDFVYEVRSSAPQK